MTINVHNYEIYLQYVFYNLLVHILISYHSSYVLVMVLYNFLLFLLVAKLPNYSKGVTNPFHQQLIHAF